MVTAVLVIVGAYVVGGFPTAALVGRRSGFDPAGAGSGNPGASNSFRLGGARAGGVVLLGDVGKGAAAAAIGLAADGRALGVAAAAAVIGHVWPVTQGFRGGKGVATAMGMVAVLHPLAAVVGALVWVAAAAVSRKAVIASIAMMVAVVVAIAWRGHGPFELISFAGVALLVVVRHRGNLTRLRRGEEPSLITRSNARGSRGAV